MKLKKVRIVIQNVGEIRETWKRALKGELRSVQKPGMLIFPTLASVAKVFSPARMELLGLIVTHKPGSISELAKLAGRDFKNVHGDVQLLAEVGVLQLARTGKGEGVRPVARYGGYEMDWAA